MSLKWRIAIALGIFIFFTWGCSRKPSLIREGKFVNENRWAVTELEASKLSEDQAAVYEALGPPDYIRFFEVLRPRREWRVGWLKKGVEYTLGRPFQKKGGKRPVTVWVYEEDEMIVTFMEGKRVDYVAVTDD